MSKRKKKYEPKARTPSRGLMLIPPRLRTKWRIEERNHACAILSHDFPDQWKDILDFLKSFTLWKSDITVPGANRSTVSKRIDEFFQEDERGWAETHFDTKFVVDDVPVETPTHKIDNFCNGVALEVEWNNKTEFYDRDLNNFRLLYDLEVISVGVIVTRLSELQDEFDRLGRGSSYGNSTTHWDKLIPKVDGGGAGGCPLLLIGMGFECYDRNR
jgi:hypothetical protein